MTLVCSTCYASASSRTADGWEMRNGAWFCPLHLEEDMDEDKDIANVKVAYVLVPQIASGPVVKLGYILATLPDGQIIKAIAESARGAEALITELLDRNQELWAYEGMLPVGLVDMREAPEEFEINQEFIELMLLTMDEMDERGREDAAHQHHHPFENGRKLHLGRRTRQLPKRVDRDEFVGGSAHREPDQGQSTPRKEGPMTPHLKTQADAERTLLVGDRLAAVVNRMVMEKSAPADIDPLADPNKLSIAYGCLVYEIGRHNCAGGGPESGYAHEPGCGYEPVLQLDTLEGWPGEPAEEPPVPFTQEEKIAYLRQLAEEFNTEDAIIETALGGAAYVRNVLLTEAEKLEETR